MARIRKARGRMVKFSQLANARKNAFLKRKSCISKMAIELCSVPADQAAIITFSPGAKAFSFCHSCDGTILNRVVLQGTMPEAVQSQHDPIMSDLLRKIKDASDQLEAQKRRVNDMMLESMSQYYWKKPINELNLAQLDMIKAKIDEIKKNVHNELLIRASASTTSPAANFVGS